MKTLYLECYSGISGDMTVAALLDLGADKEGLCRALESLGVDGYHLHFGRVSKQGIDAYDFDVHLESHAHSHEHTHEHGHDHNHPSAEAHTHGHTHEHTPHEHHEHRNLADVLALIRRAELTPRARGLAEDIFTRVARAEAKVHAKPLEEVHFHEVGAVDSIVDIVGAAYCIDNLGIEHVYCSPLYEGHGTVKCAHGLMPVPAPATSEIVSAAGLSLRLTDNEGEMVTPTGAAIAAALSQGEAPGAFRILKTGYGAGKKEFPRANVLRAHLIEESGAAPSQDQVCKLECNLDNMTGEQLGFAMERLFEAGALDVWFTPIQMKKNRPATLLSVLCTPVDAPVLEACILRHTGTLGVRRCLMERTVMQREKGIAATPYGDVEIKRAMLDGLEKVSAEYESARRTAIAKDMPIKPLYTAAEASGKKATES